MNDNLKKTFRISVLALALTVVGGMQTMAQSTLSPLHVEGRFLVDAEGVRHNLHGFCETYSPWFNEQNTKWTGLDVNGCLSYHKNLINRIQYAGWKMTFVRQHMDPHWTNVLPDGVYYVSENDIRYFNFDRFKKYLDEVYVPMAEYAISKGLYVVMRPPGVCPDNICIGDAYHQYLLKVWEYVAQHPKLCNNGCVMFELANEPINIINKNGTRAGDKEMTEYFQAIVDVMRKYCNNVLLVPGLGWQSRYSGFAEYPIQGENIGYAVHCYPGWYNGGTSDGQNVQVEYHNFKAGWESEICPVADFAPVVVTEMDWGPIKYSPNYQQNGQTIFTERCSFGFSTTGEAGGWGFGANFHKLCDDTENVSWVLFTDMHRLANYNDALPNGETFLTDPEACPRPCFRWFQYYASQEYTDLINGEDYGKKKPESTDLFPLTIEGFNPNIYASGTFNEETGMLKTGQWGFGGWRYPEGLDLSGYNYLVVELKYAQNVGASFRLFDINNYWSKPYKADFTGNTTRVVIDLHQMKAYNDEGGFDHNVDPSHIYYAGFWTTGGGPIYIKSVFVSDDGEHPSGIGELLMDGEGVARREYFTIDGRRITTPQRGINLVKETESSGKVRIFKACYK
jgi:hypothetical protein